MPQHISRCVHNGAPGLVSQSWTARNISQSRKNTWTQWPVVNAEKSTPHANGMVVHSITVEPRKNLTVVCTVSNSLGEDSMAILVASVIMESVPEGERSSGNDQAKLIVGIVVGLILAAAIVGLIYWLYMKNSRQGSWKTREKEMGTSEEEKKLEENNHKADV